MKILGLDLNLSNTGAVLLRDGEWSPAETQLVSWKQQGKGRMGDHDRVRRLDYFEREIMYLVRHWQPDLVGIESYAWAAQGNAVVSLGELGGVIRLALHRAAVPFEVVTVGEWRFQLCGNGQLPKEKVRFKLYQRYGIEHDSLDVLEAWGVARYFWLRHVGQLMISRPRRGKPSAAAQLRLIATSSG